jgi:hypothetical protein
MNNLSAFSNDCTGHLKKKHTMDAERQDLDLLSPPPNIYFDFFSKKNIIILKNRILQLREENNYFPNISFDAAMRAWLKKNDPKKWTTKCPYDLPTRLMNEKFIRDNWFLYKKNTVGNLNVFNTRMPVQVGDRNVMQNYSDFSVDTMRNLNVWRPITIGINDQIQRYNNKIPSWQRTMNIRNMDMSKEVFNINLADRESLEQSVKGYNMSRIHAASYYNRKK